MEEKSVEKEDRIEDEELEDYSDAGVCHPARNCHRYFFLVFMCSLGIGMILIID